MKAKIIVEMQDNVETLPHDIEERLEGLFREFLTGIGYTTIGLGLEKRGQLVATDGNHAIFSSEQSGDVNIKMKMTGEFR